LIGRKLGCSHDRLDCAEYNRLCDEGAVPLLVRHETICVALLQILHEGLKVLLIAKTHKLRKAVPRVEIFCEVRLGETTLLGCFVSETAFLPRSERCLVFGSTIAASCALIEPPSALVRQPRVIGQTFNRDMKGVIYGKVGGLNSVLTVCTAGNSRNHRIQIFRLQLDDLRWHHDSI